MSTSHTPQGMPNACPVCKKSVSVDPSLALGEAPCPHCGHLLWFFGTCPNVRFYSARESTTTLDRVLDRIAETLAIDRELLRTDPASLEGLGADSLDVFELVMELEAERE